jgi:hypothetical protein
MNDDYTEAGELELETLRDAFAALACEPEPATVGDHPGPDTIYDGAHGELSSGALRDVVEHIATCPRCAEEWRLAMAFTEEAEEAEAQTWRRSAAPSRPALRLVPIAATLVVALLAAGVWFTVGQSPEPTASVFRDASAGYTLVPVAPESEPLDRSDPVLRWRLDGGEAPEGTTYDLLVMSADGRDTVAEADGLESPSYTLPAEALEGLAPGTELQWTVDARLPDGQPVRSGLFVTRIP